MANLILNILRYILTIPLALIGAIIGTNYLPYLFLLYVPVGSIAYDIALFATQNIFFVLIPLIVLYNCPPKKHIKIVTTLGLIYCVMWALTIILEIILSSFIWTDLLKAIIQIITITLYLLSFSDENINTY